MAHEDDDGVVDDTEPEDDGGGRAERASRSRSGPPLALRIILGVSGLLLVVGFFLPWLRLEAVEGPDSVSGLALVMADHEVVRALIGQHSQRYVLLLIPVFGVALTAIGFLGVRYSGQVAAMMGLLIVGYGIITVLIFFFQKTGAGLWLILGGAFSAILTGVLGFLRGRTDGPAREKHDA